MTTRFQTIEQTLSWFAPCLLFCAAPVLVTIAVYTIARIWRRGERPSKTMYDAGDSREVTRVDSAAIRFAREQKKDN